MSISHFRLAVFDLDGTLKTVRDPYVYLHRRLGVAEEGEALIARGKAGQLSYEEWLRADALLWRGAQRSQLEQWLREIPYLPGAREALARLGEAGVQIAIISAGLLLHAELVADEADIDHIFANEILFEDRGAGEVVSGEVRAHVSYRGKGAVLARLQAELGIPPAETIALGDTRGDIPLFERAAFSVAVRPDHPQVAAAADIVLPDLTDLWSVSQVVR
ncbi:MAG: HAD family phosphatase [Anaerolineae bacterium]|nr:HAD family phosphatase [Anaerolineae bacterium]